ncbi:hypothetical protein IDM40_06840 [Nocardiopsis sp. HNM0947]|uniref:Uncharacterized protein n=1 Tax=Nocardiopsis coralli TaxID=2772213 RepID=A0ABR9P3L8_9ACTN|nr:hypothetical protein [Nocardiopsis coralli]MBE2998423.1 hypothetical protein [Nocardiopsis coralli]
MEENRFFFGRAMMSLALNPLLMPKAAADKLSEESSTKEVRAVIIGSLMAVLPLGALGYMSFFGEIALAAWCSALLLLYFAFSSWPSPRSTC